MAKSSSSKPALGGGAIAAANRVVRCAIYTPKSTDEGLQQEFNSLDAQREAAEAYINSQKGEGWQVVARRVSTTLRQSAKEFSEYSFLENPMRRVC
jgi:site-specific DNA recombinase